MWSISSFKRAKLATMFVRNVTGKRRSCFREAFIIDSQLFWDYATKFTGRQHPVWGAGQSLLYFEALGITVFNFFNLCFSDTKRLINV